MTEQVKKFIQENLDRIDEENWDQLLNALAINLPNHLIPDVFDCFDAAGIDTEELIQLRNDRLYHKLDELFKKLHHGATYTPEPLIRSITHWLGWSLEDFLDFIFYNPTDLWSIDFEIKDHGFAKDPVEGFYIIKIK